MGIWNAHRGQLPECRELTPVLRQNARLRLKEKPDRKVWIQVVQAIAASRFCNGDNDRSWRSDFAHLVQRGTWEKALAGKYDNRSPRQNQKQARERTRSSNTKAVGAQPFYSPQFDDDDNPLQSEPDKAGVTH